MICTANLRFGFRSSHKRCSIKKVVIRNIAIFTVIATFNLTDSCRWLLKWSYINKFFDSESYWFFIEIKKVLLSVQFTSIQNVYFRHDLFPPNNGISPFFLSLSNIINLFDISLLVKSMFLYHETHSNVLKVLNKVNFRVFVIDLLSFAKLLELLAINDSASERRIILFPSVVEVLSCSGCFITWMGAHFPADELHNMTWFSTLSRMSGFLWHSSNWEHWFSRFLQYTSEIKVLPSSLDTNLNYVTIMLQLPPSLNH